MKRTYKVYIPIPVHENDSTWYQYEEYSGITHTKYKDAKDELRKARIKYDKNAVIRYEEVYKCKAIQPNRS